MTILALLSCLSLLAPSALAPQFGPPPAKARPQVAAPVQAAPLDRGPLAGTEAHDLAIVGLTAPKSVKLKPTGVPVSKVVKVKIQNRSAHEETIPDLATLAELVQLEVEALGAGCTAPIAELIDGKPNVVPRTVKSKKSFTVAFRVTFDCAVDAFKGPDHADFRYLAHVEHAALDGNADTHPEDDDAPRPPLPGGVDPNPDGKIKDKGAGAKLPGGGLGGDVITDVIDPGNTTNNHKPQLGDDSVATLIDTAVPVFVLANDADADGDALSIIDFTQPANGTVTVLLNVATFTPDSAFEGTTGFSYTVSDGTGTSTASATVKVVTLPPDPSTLAPPPDKGVATTVSDATNFLFTGSDAIQFGVEPGTIQPARAAVLHGTVRGRGEGGLSGVRITMLDCPQYGTTFSRDDGAYDLAVNGGGVLTVKYEKEGFCPVERQLEVPQQDYAPVFDVAMVPWDASVSEVTFGASAPLQVHAGSTQTDAEGSRKATLLIPAGTEASLVSSDGAAQSVSTLHIRATEFTVGPDGPAAMPGNLPPTSGYTYCVELSADEAGTGGATAASVVFSQPIFTYVENYIGFPVGTIVPIGAYDAEKAAWIASANGRIVAIVGITGSLADVDTDGDTVADNAGLADSEREQLALLFTPGESIWRVPITHFTPWDCNWPFGPPDDAVSPADNGADADNADEALEDTCECPGSIIETDNQVLGESLPIVGTPYTLNYRSDRVAGRGRALELALTGATVPASLQSVSFHVEIAGQEFEQTFAPALDLATTIVWDGLDAYGQPVQGGQVASGSIDYVYPGVYDEPGTTGQSFGQFGSGTEIDGDLDSSTITISKPFEKVLGEGLTDATTLGLGGWTLSEHYVYDPISRVVLSGGGGRRQTAALGRIVTTIAGNGESGSGGDGGPATEAQLAFPIGLAVAPDGSVFIADEDSAVIRRVDPDGVISTFAGTGEHGFSGDGGPATDAQLDFPLVLALGADGSLYFSDPGQNRVRKVDPDGIITTVAGSGNFGISADGGLATATDLAVPQGLAVAPDGTLFIGERDALRVRRVGTDGIITTITGNGVAVFSGDGGPAALAQIDVPAGVTLGPDGSLYIATFDSRIRRITQDGIIRTVAGIGVDGFSGDGGPALEAALTFPTYVAPTADGGFYIADRGNNRIRFVDAQGTISTVAGKDPQVFFAGDGGPGPQAEFDDPEVAVVAPDGSLYITDVFNGRVRRLAPPLPGFSASDILVASEDGEELYEFDEHGRHLTTRSALTGGVLRAFTYDGNGLLASVIEKTGGTDNVTTIQHDGNGHPTAIVGPYGHVTNLTVDAHGFLASISNPAGEQTDLVSATDGLLTSLTDPRGNTSQFTYDAAGRLTLDEDPVGGTQELTRVAAGSSVTITRTTALGRETSYATETLPGHHQLSTITASDGTQSGSDEAVDDGTLQGTASDGTTTDVTFRPDPRFGMQSPVLATSTLHFGGALDVPIVRTRGAALANPADPFSVTTLTETSSIAGATTGCVFTTANRTMVITTPEDRTETLVVDALGRYVEGQTSGLAPRHATYDERGRLSLLDQGSGVGDREVALEFNSDGLLDTLSDPLGRQTQLTYDAADRVTTKTLPGGQVVTYAYDEAGNLTSLTPPGHAAYTFAYSDRNERTLFTPPVLAGTGSTAYAYDLDRAPTTVTRPGNETVTMAYDTAGRRVGRTLATGGITDDAVTIGYDVDGRVNSIDASSGVAIDLGYDGSLITGETWSGTIAGSVTKSYDDSVRVASQSVNGAQTVDFAYDDDSLLIGAGSLLIARDPEHGLAAASALGVVSTSIAYNEFGEVTGETATGGGGTLLGEALTRDALGRITQKVETIGGATDTYVYTYDLAGQLTAVSKNGTGVESYAYDASSNRTNATVGGTSTAASYDAHDRLTLQDTTTFAYSAAGDLLSTTAGTDVTTYDHDALGNLRGAVLPDGTTIDYVIDGRNRRVGKSVNGLLAQGFLYGDMLRPVAELDSSGAVVSRFVYAEGHTPAFMIKGGVTFRMLADPTGSVRLVVNIASGAIAQRIDYDSFGNVVQDTSPGFQPFGFAGGLRDADTGFVRFGARDYDPTTGRWTTPDPVGFQGGDFNLYRYVGNDPVNATDPSGLYSFGDFIDDIVETYELIEKGMELKDQVDDVEKKAEQVYQANDDYNNPSLTCGEKGLNALHTLIDYLPDENITAPKEVLEAILGQIDLFNEILHRGNGLGPGSADATSAVR